MFIKELQGENTTFWEGKTNSLTFALVPSDNASHQMPLFVLVFRLLVCSGYPVEGFGPNCNAISLPRLSAFKTQRFDVGSGSSAPPPSKLAVQSFSPATVWRTSLCWAHLSSEEKMERRPCRFTLHIPICSSARPTSQMLTERRQLGQVFHLAMKQPLSAFNRSSMFGCSTERTVGRTRRLHLFVVLTLWTRNDSGFQLERWAVIPQSGFWARCGNLGGPGGDESLGGR